MKFSSAGAWIRFIPLAAILWFGIAITAASREDPSPPPNTGSQVEKAGDNFKIKVDVEEVRIDATILDGKGRQVTDLTADDFEIRQDGKKQDIVDVKYISYDRGRPEKRDEASPDLSAISTGTQPLPERGKIKRSILFLVNSFGFNNFADFYRARMSLHKYVEDRMMPGDMVSLLKNDRGGSNLLSFTTDKRELLARIETIQWCSLTLDPFSAEKAQILGIAYGLKALQNLPGRKILVLVTYDRSVLQSNIIIYSRLADQALRSGVVVHTMDIRGIEVELSPAVDSKGTEKIPAGLIFPRPESSNHSSNTPSLAQIEIEKEMSSYPRWGEAKLPLSRKTGGLSLDNNFFVNGIGDLEEAMKGYYLISYIPPENTFSKSGLKSYHKIQVKIKRRGAEAYARDGFYGAPMSLPDLDDRVSPMVEAMFSPFRYNALNVSLASGYVDNPRGGYLVPTWMHLDGKNLDITEDDGGNRFVSFKVAATMTDIDGIITDYGETQAKLDIGGDDVRRLRENGINYSVSIPVKKAGGHYVRIAVKDLSTGSMGSAYQFIDVPDLKKKILALSSLYIIHREEDAAWLRSVATEESEKSLESIREVANRNPAYRDFRHGDAFEYMGVIYNAKTKKDLPPELESSFILYRDGQEIHRSVPEIVVLDGVHDFTRIPIRGKIEIGESMQPGDYILQFLVKDKQAREKQNLTAQTLDFRISAP